MNEMYRILLLLSIAFASTISKVEPVGNKLITDIIGGLSEMGVTHSDEDARNNNIIESFLNDGFAHGSHSDVNTGIGADILIKTNTSDEVNSKSNDIGNRPNHKSFIDSLFGFNGGFLESLLGGKGGVLKGLVSAGNGAIIKGLLAGNGGILNSLLGGILGDKVGVLKDVIRQLNNLFNGLLKEITILAEELFKTISQLAQQLATSLKGVDATDSKALKEALATQPLNHVCNVCHTLQDREAVQGCRDFCTGSPCQWRF